MKSLRPWVVGRLAPAERAAYGRLGLLYGIYANWPWHYPGLTADSLLARGLAAAHRAIALDSNSVDGWLARGFLLIPHAADAETQRGFALDPSFLVGSLALVCPPAVADCARQAVTVLARATQLGPRDAEVWYQYGRALHVADYLGGRSSAGDSALRRSLVLDADRAVSAWLLGMSYLRQRRWEDAATMLDSAIALGRSDPSVFSLRMHVRLARGDVAGARSDLEAIGRLLSARTPVDPATLVYRAAMQVVVDARAGDSAVARARLAELRRRNPPATAQSRIVPLSLAAAHIALGGRERQRGVALLEQVPRLNSRTLQHPLWDPVRNDPRFRDIEERVREDR